MKNAVNAIEAIDKPAGQKILDTYSAALERTLDRQPKAEERRAESAKATPSPHDDWTDWLRDARAQIMAAAPAELARIKTDLDEPAMHNGGGQEVLDQLSAAFHQRRKQVGRK